MTKQYFWNLFSVLQTPDIIIRVLFVTSQEVEIFGLFRQSCDLISNPIGMGEMCSIYFFFLFFWLSANKVGGKRQRVEHTKNTANNSNSMQFDFTHCRMALTLFWLPTSPMCNDSIQITKFSFIYPGFYTRRHRTIIIIFLGYAQHHTFSICTNNKSRSTQQGGFFLYFKLETTPNTRLQQR